MKSRYLVRIEAELAAAASPSERCVPLARKAFHYARLGECELVSHLVDELRMTLLEGDWNLGQAVCWINIAEGIVCHYDARTSDSRLKWLRSRAIAESLEARDAAALASAWLALSYYLSEELDLLATNSIDSIRRTDSGNYSAISRFSLNIALCYHYIGQVDVARKWYTNSRLAAVSDGDEATLAALIHSMAWMSVSSARTALLSDVTSCEQKDLLVVKAETVESYEMLVGARSFPALTPLLRAHESIIHGQHSSAINIIDEHLVAAGKQGFERLSPGLLADRAHCLLRLGRLSEAEASARQAHQLSRALLHSDDRAVLHSTLSGVFGELEISSLADHHRQEASVAYEGLRAFRLEMADALERVASEVRKSAVYSTVLDG
jgi:tetratricopeptide (TPR) repeat protein